MNQEELDYISQSTKTLNELYLAELGSFEDDPSADDVYIFALKMNENMVLLDDTISKSLNNSLELEMLRDKGTLGEVIYGGSYGVS